MVDMPAADIATLHALAEDLGDVDIVREVVRTYLAELPGRRAAMAAALDSGDVAGLRFGAHGLGSASTLVGAHEVAAACGRIEYASAAQAPDEWAALVAAWDDANSRAEAGLRSWLDAPPVGD